MLDLVPIQKFSEIPGIEPIQGITNGIKGHLSNICYDTNIFDKSNEFYRKSEDSWKIEINPFHSDLQPLNLIPEASLCLIEINNLINQIKLDLEHIIKEEDKLDLETKLYYWSYDDKYYYSSSKAKVYFDILFKQNYIYLLFGSFNGVNIWNLDSDITIHELIGILMDKSNDLKIKQIDNIIVLK